MESDVLTNIIKEEINNLLGNLSEEELNEVTPPGREDQVKKLKQELPKTYTDKSGRKKESNPWAVAWASYNKEGLQEIISNAFKEEISKLGLK